MMRLRSSTARRCPPVSLNRQAPSCEESHPWQPAAMAMAAMRGYVRPSPGVGIVEVRAGEEAAP